MARKPKAPAKITIQEKVDSLYGSDFEGSLIAIREQLDYLEGRHGSNLRIEKGFDYDGCMNFVVYKVREETDAEYQKRLSEQKEILDRQEALERKQYEKLKKKYG